MYCPACGRENEAAAQFCAGCGGQIATTTEVVHKRPETEPLEPEQRMRGIAPQRARQGELVPTGKKPGLAILFSAILTGGGQFYNRDFIKGAILLVAAIVAASTIRILAVAIWLYSIVDAYQVAKGRWRPMGSKRVQWAGRS
jgi:TM2 domain-containing membrane protein YozV